MVQCDLHLWHTQLNRGKHTSSGSKKIPVLWILVVPYFRNPWTFDTTDGRNVSKVKKKADKRIYVLRGV